MQTSFSILTAITVPQLYSWDNGIPFVEDNALEYANCTTNYVSGYAPALLVAFQDNSTPDKSSNNLSYNWDFGDYYNSTSNNVSLTCASFIQHTYIMPGIYHVKLTQSETTTQQAIDPSYKCVSLYNKQWFWDDLTQNTTNTTWNSTSSTATQPKTWNREQKCLQKYCFSWDWTNLGCNTKTTKNGNSVTWKQTTKGEKYAKKWAYEVNDTPCTITNAEYLTTYQTIIQTTQSAVVQVLELPPVAGIGISDSTITGTSPFTVRFTAKACKAGSFPIDKIVWDLGDGTPRKTVIRYTAPTDNNFITTDTFNDPNDVRNYELVHTYSCNANTYPVFYPSLTCYSANTNTSDSCCLTIGPISLPFAPSETRLLKVRNNMKGNLYTLNIDNNVAFITTALSSNNFTLKEYPNVPPTILRDSTSVKILPRSNRGTVDNISIFPPRINPICVSIALTLPTSAVLLPYNYPYIATENDQPYDQTIGTAGLTGIEIDTEDNFYIIP